jgi:septum formation protein
MLECPLDGHLHCARDELKLLCVIGSTIAVTGKETERQAFTLASASPRRRDLMGLTGWDVRVISTDVNERTKSGEDAQALARRLAEAKARSALERSNPEGILLAADTVVEYEGRLLGKPGDERDALRMLTELRGRNHTVVTALAISQPGNGSVEIEACKTSVPMREYATEELRAYVASGRAFDKAGGYGIQDEDFHPVDVDRLAGCFANVMGLPLCHLVRAARRMGVEPPIDVPAACQAYTSYTCPVYAEILRDAS